MNIALLPITVILKPLAYLDPGTGSMLLQMVLGGLLGAGILLKAFWKKIFKSNKSTDENDLEQESEDNIDADDLNG